MSNVKLSKKLSSVLRHNASNMGLRIDPDGYVSVRELLRCDGFRGTNVSDIVDVVQNCPKRRFEIKEVDNGATFIRATQGHTIRAVKDDALLEELSVGQVSQYCIHGTYRRNIESIRSSGLNRMSRNHVHLTEDNPASGEAISGMRGSCDTIVIVDVHKAMAAGLKFYRSSNGVVLCPGLGDTGAIGPEFIAGITDRFGTRTNTPQTHTHSQPPTCKSSSYAAATSLQKGGLCAVAAFAPPATAGSISCPATASNPPDDTVKSRISRIQTAAYGSLPPSAPHSYGSPPPLPPPPDAPPPDYFCVIDFEATCLDGRHISPQEIIEFPAIMVEASSMRIIPEEENGLFHSYVRPVHHPRLSAFCTELTGIQQSTVDAAPQFTQVFHNFICFLQSWDIDVYRHEKALYQEESVPMPKRVVFVTHGDWDLKTMLPSQCTLSSVKIPPIMRSWANIKDIFRTLPKKPRRQVRGLGMASMLDILDLELIGHHHSGIDDTRNISRILVELARRGAVLDETWHGQNKRNEEYSHGKGKGRTRK